MTPPPALQLRNVSFQYPDRPPLINRLSLLVPQRRLVCLLGESGSGKTTLLRLCAGFEHPLHGHIFVNGQDVRRLPPQQRNIGFVFQDNTLFPHLRVLQNVAFGVQGLQPRAAQKRARQTLALCQAESLADALPHTLSAGEAQRVALARALAPHPHIILMDEPFSNLNASLKTSVQIQTRRALSGSGASCLFVTHDQNEAMQIADAVALIHNGSVIQYGNPQSLRLNPVSSHAATLLGDANLIPAALQNGVAHVGPLRFPSTLNPQNPVLMIRPEHLLVHPPHNSSNTFNASVSQCSHLGDRIALVLQHPLLPPLRAHVHPSTLPNAPNVGDTIPVAPDPKYVRVVPQSS